MGWSIGDYVRINENPLSWRILKIEGPLALLESGQTRRQRTEPVVNLTPWYPVD